MRFTVKKSNSPYKGLVAITPAILNLYFDNERIYLIDILYIYTYRYVHTYIYTNSNTNIHTYSTFLSAKLNFVLVYNYFIDYIVICLTILGKYFRVSCEFKLALILTCVTIIVCN